MPCIDLPAAPPAPDSVPVFVPPPPPPPAPAPSAPPSPVAVPGVVIDLANSFVKTNRDCLGISPWPGSFPVILASGGIEAGFIAEVDILLTNTNPSAPSSINIALTADTTNVTIAGNGPILQTIPVPAGASVYVSWIATSSVVGSAVMTIDNGVAPIKFNISFTASTPCSDGGGGG